MPRQLPFAIAAFAIALAACGDSPTAPPPGDPPPALVPGTFALTRVNGQTLPAEIGQRTIGGEVERILADSARITIRADRTFEQVIWTRTVRGNQPRAAEGWTDVGTWAVSGRDYRFASTTSGRVLTVSNRASGRLEIAERLSLSGGVTQALGEYRPWTPPQTPPPPPPPPPPPATQTWRATDVGGVPLPFIAYRFPDEPAPGNETYFQLDSARVRLRSDLTYEQVVWYSEWQSPNPALSLGYVRVNRYAETDRGTYVRNGNDFTLASSWFQNRVMIGEIGGAVGSERFRLRHGLGVGDPNLFVGYAFAGWN